jgi:hypothetical protein
LSSLVDFCSPTARKAHRSCTSVGVVTRQLTVAVFLVAQAWDGLLTYAAVQLFGISAEGNPLLATWMTLVGPGSAIIGAKVMASGCGILLHCLGTDRVLFGLTVLYGVAAIGPWLAIFHGL